jgi:hypothetical protein
MEWYCALTQHLLNKNTIVSGNLLEELEKMITTLYEALLFFQIKSVCYYQHRVVAFLRGLANWDDWDGDLKRVTDAEAALESSLIQNYREYEKSTLRKLVDSGNAMETLLGNIHQDLRAFIAQQKERLGHDRDAQCLQDLFVMDPQDKMATIQRTKKEVLLHDVCDWIFDTDEYVAFTNWGSDGSTVPSSRLLWVKGPAGTGKTMLMMGIIRQLSGQLAVLSPTVSHFFCQSTDDKADNSTAVLRSLIWMLIIQQDHLITHLRTQHRHEGVLLFTDESAWDALSRLFERMLKDSHSAVYFVVDALDECGQGLDDLLELISTSLHLSDKVRWLVSSRPEVDVLAKLKHREVHNQDKPTTLVDLDTRRLEGPVNIYIRLKLSDLERSEVGHTYQPYLKTISNLICQRAEDNFLWMSLLFKDLKNTRGPYAIQTIKDYPSGLSELYEHKMTRIGTGNIDLQHCKDILVATTLASRPLSLSELGILVPWSATNDPYTVVEECDSFLTISGETVFIIHKSAKDYLMENFLSKLPSGVIAQVHADIYKRSLAAMSSLRQNIYGLSNFGQQLRSLTPPDPDPLAPMRYSCVFWLNHLCASKDQSSIFKDALADNGAVLEFFNDHFLHWVESLSLLGRLADGASSIKGLLTEVSL